MSCFGRPYSSHLEPLSLPWSEVIPGLSGLSRWNLHPSSSSLHPRKPWPWNSQRHKYASGPMWASVLGLTAGVDCEMYPLTWGICFYRVRTKDLHWGPHRHYAISHFDPRWRLRWKSSHLCHIMKPNHESEIPSYSQAPPILEKELYWPLSRNRRGSGILGSF